MRRPLGHASSFAVVAPAYLLRSVSALLSIVAVAAVGGPGGVTWVRAAASLRPRLIRALSLAALPLLSAASVLAHAWGLRGQPWDQVLFPVAFLGMLTIPIGVGYLIATHDPGERTDGPSLLAAIVVTLGMVLMLAGLLTYQLVASVIWPEGNWPAQLLLGFVLLALPTAAATRAVLHGIGALAASQADA